VIFTIGHSTRTLDELITLLQRHGVGLVADVRSIPRSRRHPHFAAEALAASLPQAGLAYRHFPGLGGLRRPRPDSINTAWRHQGFRGFADYMQTPAFEQSVDELVRTAEVSGPAAIMCAEAVWWRCHRQLIADALVARGVDVRHIVNAGEARSHELSELAVIREGGVIYPGLL
jgi:uncharacterized protein (DUF488 family)